VIFASVYEAGKVSRSWSCCWFIGLANTGFSLFYYVRVIKTMLLDARPAGALRWSCRSIRPRIYVALVAFPVVFLGLNIDWLEPGRPHRRDDVFSPGAQLKEFCRMAEIRAQCPLNGFVSPWAGAAAIRR